MSAALLDTYDLYHGSHIYECHNLHNNDKVNCINKLVQALFGGKMYQIQLHEGYLVITFKSSYSH